MFERIGIKCKTIRALPHLYLGIDLADKALEYIARTKLVEGSCTISNHLLYALFSLSPHHLNLFH